MTKAYICIYGGVHDPIADTCIYISLDARLVWWQVPALKHIIIIIQPLFFQTSIRQMSRSSHHQANKQTKNKRTNKQK